MKSLAAKLGIPTLVWFLGLSCFFLLRSYALTQPGSSALPWDTSWYAKIVDHGYSYDGNPFVQHNVVFMPLYPYSVRLVKAITGITSTNTAMLFTAAAYSFFSLRFLYKIVSSFYNTSVAFGSTLIFVFSPYSFYLFNGYAECCFVFFAMAFFHAFLVQRRFFTAAVWASLSVLAKQIGVLLIGFYVGALLYEAGTSWTKRPALAQRALSTLGCSFPFLFVGLAMHTIFLHFRFKDPLLFANALAGWTLSGPTTPRSLGDLTDSLVQAFFVGMEAIRHGDAPLSLAYKIFVFANIVVLFSLWRRPSLFVLLYFLGFWVFNIIFRPATIILDLGRYLLMLFPLFFCLPDLLYSISRPNKMIYWISIIIIVAVCFYFYTDHIILFYQNKWVS